MTTYETKPTIDTRISWSDVRFQLGKPEVDPSPVDNMPLAYSTYVTLTGRFLSWSREVEIRIISGKPVSPWTEDSGIGDIRYEFEDYSRPQVVPIHATREYHDACLEILSKLQRDLDEVASWIAGCRPGTFEARPSHHEYPYTPYVAPTEEELATNADLYRLDDDGDAE